MGPGFGFVRSFLWLILLLAGGMVALAGLLSWHFGMDVTVEGQGIVEPRDRHQVKAVIAGIIKEVHVRSGQQVDAGDLLVTLDDADWRTELQKIDADLEVNRSQKREIEQQMEQDRRIRSAEVVEARLNLDRVRIQLEQIVAEQTLYSTVALAPEGLVRRPLQDLVPVRLGNAALRQGKADLALAEQRLRGVEGRGQELRTLEKRRQKLQQDLARIQSRLAQSRIAAPGTGTVLAGDLKRRVGDRIEAGEAILEVAGTDAWQARVMIKETDLPRIEPGQQVKLYIDAFPHMEYKIFEGMVEEVPTTPSEVAPDGCAVYSLRVSILDPEVADGHRVYSLAQGMNTRAKVVVTKGRILELLWKKLMREGGKASQGDFHLQQEG